MGSFDRFEKDPRFIRWTTRGEHSRFAVVNDRGIRWAIVRSDRGGIAMTSAGCFYRDHDGRGMSALMAATRAVRVVLSKNRAFCRQYNLDPTYMATRNG